MATAAASVKTVQFVDPRIEPQPDPVYQYVVGPVQNQYYQQNASSKSDSSITFNNLTTLGIDRAYLDTFEIEIGAHFVFNVAARIKVGTASGAKNVTPPNIHHMVPSLDELTFQSFPFNTCCEEARVNINGGAFFSQPLSYVRAKERYMNQKALSDCYANVCPCHRPILQTESGRAYNETPLLEDGETPYWNADDSAEHYDFSATEAGIPTRLGVGMYGCMQSETGLSGAWNNAIIKLGKKLDDTTEKFGWENYYMVKKANDGDYLRYETHLIVTWREPLFVSPFSSRYDATYGRPLYNITSMDFAFTLMNLGNMIRLANIHHDPHLTSTTAAEGGGGDGYTNFIVTGYSVSIHDMPKLCYQVMTIPKTVKKPLTTLVPYRRFVPYVTNIEGRATRVVSGTYTMNEIPTAIWVFVAPDKAYYQNNDALNIGTADTSTSTQAAGNWDNNKLFAYLKHISITLANTTQILNQAKPHDLYRIAKANGCEDSYWSWAGNNTAMPKLHGGPMFHGAGSVLRLKPGIDLIVPDAALIPGSNANNMVIQVTVEELEYPPIPAITTEGEGRNNLKYSLWLLFEYVGVASISPGQCEISMNPVGGGQVMGVSPIMSATNETTMGTLDGSGFWDKQNRRVAIQRHIGDNGIISRIMNLPSGAQAADWAEAHGVKRPRGGAVIGRGGLSEWV